MSDFLLPDLGEGLAEAEIVEWHVGIGDRVVTGQPLVSVETDKSVVEIPSPRSGTVAALHGQPGDLVAVGAVLVAFGEGGQDAGSVVGRLPAGPLRAAPAVRALAARLGVALAGLTGTGPGGTVTSADVAAAAGTGAGTAAEPLRGVRRAMAANMSRAHREVVRATVHDVVDIGSWPAGTDPTMRLVRAIGVAAAAVPICNAEFVGPEAGLRMAAQVHVGVAVETDDGLFVPVLRDVVGRTPEDLRAGLQQLRTDVAARSIPAEELKGATITLSNFGMFGGTHAEMVVIPPQVAILGAGRIHDAALVREGALVVRRVLPLSLSFDHRVVTGVEATRFLAAVMADLAAP
jgi:pyruvate dehydrogenase E2 component (dihydrolipoamide acetyltransferase)